MANPIVQGNQSVDYITFSRGVSPTILINNDITLSINESGCDIHIISFASDINISLPAATPAIAGCTYKFIQYSPMNGNTTTIDCGGGICYGTVVMDGAATNSGVAVRYVRFLPDASQDGDSIVLTCDGAHWTGLGFSSFDGGIEFTN